VRLTAGPRSGEPRALRVRVRRFASLRETAGVSEAVLELGAGASAEDAWRELSGRHPALAARRSSLAASINRRYADFATPLAEGDEVVFIPPVSGG
jgi:molybdopterin converting factor subunit 1